YVGGLVARKALTVHRVRAASLQNTAGLRTLRPGALVGQDRTTYRAQIAMSAAFDLGSELQGQPHGSGEIDRFGDDDGHDVASRPRMVDRVGRASRSRLDIGIVHRAGSR